MKGNKSDNLNEKKKKRKRKTRKNGGKGKTRKNGKKEEKEYEFEIRKLEFQVKLGSDPSVEKSNAKFDVTKHIKFVPPFQQADVDKFFFFHILKK